MTPERLKMIEQRMRERGMSEAQIEERLQQMRQGPPPAAEAAPENGKEGAAEPSESGATGAGV
jgi:DNA-binding transcriptional MerR regulator